MKTKIHISLFAIIIIFFPCNTDNRGCGCGVSPAENTIDYLSS